MQTEKGQGQSLAACPLQPTPAKELTCPRQTERRRWRWSPSLMYSEIGTQGCCSNSQLPWGPQ